MQVQLVLFVARDIAGAALICTCYATYTDLVILSLKDLITLYIYLLERRGLASLRDF